MHDIDIRFSGSSVVKNPPANAGDVGSIPELGRFPGGGNGKPLQYSCLGNPLDRGAWWVTVHGVAKSRTQLSDWTELTALCLGPAERCWPVQEEVFLQTSLCRPGALQATSLLNKNPERGIQSLSSSLVLDHPCYNHHLGKNRKASFSSRKPLRCSYKTDLSAG